MRKVVFKSSAHYYGCEQDDPAFFTEGMRRPHAPRTRLESDIVEAEKAVDGFAQRNPEVTVTVLRFCNALGPDLRTTHTRLFDLPAVPAILGFDPRYQFIHEEDLVDVLALRRRARPAGRLQRGRRRRPGAVGGRVAARQAAGPDPAAVGQLAGRRRAAPTRRARLVGSAPNQLRYGAGSTTASSRRPADAFGYTSREAVLKHAEALRARPLRRGRGRALPLRARGRGVPASGARVSAERALCNARAGCRGSRSGLASTISRPHVAPSDRRTRPHRHRAPRGRGPCTRTTSRCARGSPTASRSMGSTSGA